MNKQNERVNTALFAAAVLLSLTLFTSHLTSGLYARYTASATGSDSARVARYAFDVKGGTDAGEFTIDLGNIQMPGNSDTCTFKVTNTNANGVCEVAQKYTVYVTELGSLPLTYSISSTSPDAVSGEGQTQQLPNASAAWGGSETALLSDTLKAGTEESDTITLTVSWPESYADVSYAGGAASLHVRIAAEQIN